jgi:iron complex outermembrane recepter protein
LNCSLYEGLHLETGLAFNTTQYSLEDLFLQENRNPKQSYTFGNVWSPRIGLSYEILPLKNIYASVSNGFSVPTVAESLTPEGKINSNLKSELGWNYELGFKGNWLNNKLYTELTFFSTQISNLLVSRRTAEDQYVGINAGESSHKGLEFLMNYDIIKSAHFQLKSNFSLAVNNFKFKEFIDGDQNHSGNKLTGVPDSQYSLGLELLTGGGFSINSSFSKVGQIPLNDQNSKYSQEYHLLNIKAVYSFTILQKLKTELSAGVSNLMDSHYAASILPNAVGFGKALPRYYYPGNPRNYFGGVALSYLLF